MFAVSVRRRKGFFTLLFVLSCVIYFNWLVNISDYGSPSTDKLSDTAILAAAAAAAAAVASSLDEAKMVAANAPSGLIIYEIIEANQRSNSTTIDNNNNMNMMIQPNRFFLLSARNGPPTHSKSALVAEPLSPSEMRDLLGLLFDYEAFLFDVDLLSQMDALSPKASIIDKDESSKSSSNEIDEKVNYILNGLKLGSKIGLGIFLRSFNHLNNNLHKELNKKCRLTQSYGQYGGETILTSFYIECKELLVQISIVYERGSFLWIGEDNFETSERKHFGDTPRAFKKFGLIQLIDQTRNTRFWAPKLNAKTFQFEYDHSRFLECNRDLAMANLKRVGKSYEQNEKRNKMISKVTEHISDTLESFHKHYWLAGGTLLGWYRDCGIIPHTQDVDMAIWAHEYEPKIKQHFLGNKIVRVWGTLGLRNDSYEFRLFNDQFTFDMFLVYNLNETHQWCGYQVNRVKFRRYLPKFDRLCSAELLNHKYMVPCDPVGYLDREYGTRNWHSPQSKNYSWSNVAYWKNWTDSEWPHAVRYYDKSGALLKQKVLAYLNKHMKRNLTDLPVDAD